MDDLDDDDNDGSPNGGLRLELIQGYLAFARRAVRARWKTSVAVFVVGLALTVAALKYIPRTYACTTVLMAQSSGVLDGRDSTNALAGAEGIILRQENLEGIIRTTGLIKKSALRRPPLLRLKDRIVSAVFGEMDEKTRMASLVGTIESKITIETEKGQLSINVDWSDSATTAEIADAARESFLKARHGAEMSAFEDKMSILDGHATKLRDEIGELAQRLKSAREEQVANARAAKSGAASAAAAATGDAPVVVRRVVRQSSGGSDAQIPALKEKLAALKAKLGTLEAERESRVRAAQAKYDDLKLRFTASHPEVVTQRERIAVASQTSSEVALMQAEVKDIQSEIEQREGLAKQGGGITSIMGTAARTPSTAEVLPAEITDLLGGEGGDPALTAQLSSSVTKYSSLRGDLFATQVDLDTAQAAFNHRYQVIVPAEAPGNAYKPKPAVIFGAGFVFSLVLALMLPILAALRADIITERWQAEHIALPILAELRLPPHSSD